MVRSNSTIFLVFGPYLLAPRSNFDDLVVYGKFPRSNFLLILYSMESLWSVIRSRDAPLSTAPLPPLRWLSGWLPSVTSSRLALVCQVHSTLLPPTSLIMDLPVELEKKVGFLPWSQISKRSSPAFWFFCTSCWSFSGRIFSSLSHFSSLHFLSHWRICGFCLGFMSWRGSGWLSCQIFKWSSL